jgi:hypothetical protein
MKPLGSEAQPQASVHTPTRLQLGTSCRGEIDCHFSCNSNGLVGRYINLFDHISLTPRALQFPLAHVLQPTHAEAQNVTNTHVKTGPGVGSYSGTHDRYKRCGKHSLEDPVLGSMG